MATKEVPQPLYSGESLMDFAKRILHTRLGIAVTSALAIATGVATFGSILVGTSNAIESNTGNSTKPRAAEPQKFPDHLGLNNESLASKYRPTWFTDTGEERQIPNIPGAIIEQQVVGDNPENMRLITIYLSNDNGNLVGFFNKGKISLLGK